ncbi:nuclear pore complex protein Nup50-like [Babylonia areolata]|uniref:nuclear pore complex protein Nup50-like n=1 Tax=Babylonia areolata TaxID=304850 RepID=UPI003FD2541C
MSKRKPTSELNDRNWDQEDEPEEAGTFSSAGQDVLKNRVIRKAKRTLPTDPEKRNSGSVFAGFALKTSDSSVPKPSLSTGVTLNFGSNLTFQPKSNGTEQTSSNDSKKDSTDNPEYLRQLKVLNENILSWIQKHVEKNPYCILTPSFKDYEKHLSDLEKKYSIDYANSSQEKSKPGAPPASSQEKTEAPSIFGAGTKASGAFTFGQSSKVQSPGSSDKPDKAGASVTTAASGFSFTSGLTQSTGGFGASSLTQNTGAFGASAKPFSFGLAAKPTTDSAAAAPPQASSAAKGDEDEEYQPPKVEVREIKEEGAVYTKRCKLFYQKDGEWIDRGVGNIHMKPTDEGRTQLIIRADTNLGNILLNILLTSAIPTKRQGKNNVFVVCVPNPPINPKDPSTSPVPMLIRVKTAEDADELLAKMEELKA